jgi:hypothetical protein
MDRAWAYGLQRQAEFGQEGFFRLYRRYAERQAWYSFRRRASSRAATRC